MDRAVAMLAPAVTTVAKAAFDVLRPVVTKAGNNLQENLTNVLEQNLDLINDAKGDFLSLLDEAQGLNALLAADYAELNMNSHPTKWDKLPRKILRTIYRAEDSIDKFLAQAKIHQDSTLKRFLQVDKVNRFTKLPEIQNILKELREIRQQTQQAIEEIRQQTGQQSKYISTAQDSALEEHKVIGFDKSAEEVRERLLKGSSSKNLEVASIVGMPGLGKTTLARKIYNDPGIGREYYKRVWVYVGVSYIEKDVLLNIHEGLGLKSSGVQDKNEKQLAEIIHDFVIKGGRCLIVLDDVWEAKAVDFVMTAFPCNEGYHRILMTTREMQVATPVSTYLHKLKFLEKQEAFELLENRVFGIRKKFPVEFVGYGNEILESCSGVPLAIVVIAGVLKSCSYRIEWETVAKNVGQLLVTENDPDSCKKFVEVSYNHLPLDKRAPFLYISVFPRGFDIPAWKLIRLWIAEGLIKYSFPNSEIEVNAEYCLNDIANRNLVIVTQKSSDNGQVKTFRVHDMVHEFCNEEAKQTCIFQNIHPATPTLSTPSIRDSVTSRRLSIKSSIPHNFIPKDEELEHVRSFLCYSPKGIDVSNVEIKLLPKAFPLIRVCDIQPFIFEFPKEFYKLFHMRYLAVSGEFQFISPLFGNFWNLQTLLLHTNQSTLSIPKDLWKMLQLRHLHTNKPVTLQQPPTPITKSSCLQTLSKIAPESCTTHVLKKACNLKKLGIEGKLETLCRFECFVELKCLERLKMLNGVVSPNIQLPQSFSTYLQTLKKLTLSCSKIDWSNANELGKLESLEVLKLKDNACIGDTWTPEKGSFKLLQVLWIQITDLKTWDTLNCGFGHLRRLVLISCRELLAVPCELANSPHLTEIRLKNTQKAVNSAKEIKEKKIKMQAPGNIEFNLVIEDSQADAK